MTTGPEDPQQQPPNPYGAPPPYGQPQYQQPQQPYGQPYQQPYGQQYPYQPQAPKHPSAMTSMVLGIIGLGSILLCGGIGLVLSPFAWAMGSKAVKEIDAAPPGTYSGRDNANAGKVMGIVGTVLLILGVLAIIAFIVLVVAVGSTSSSTYGY